MGATTDHGAFIIGVADCEAAVIRPELHWRGEVVHAPPQLDDQRFGQAPRKCNSFFDSREGILGPAASNRDGRVDDERALLTLALALVLLRLVSLLVLLPSSVAAGARRSRSCRSRNRYLRRRNRAQISQIMTYYCKRA